VDDGDCRAGRFGRIPLLEDLVDATGGILLSESEPGGGQQEEEARQHGNSYSHSRYQAGEYLNVLKLAASKRERENHENSDVPSTACRTGDHARPT
jgi:hypothetical protein